MDAKVLVLTGFGINCDYETEAAFRLAGAEPKRVHLNDVIEDKAMLDDFHIMAIPGGFSFGDDIASGKVFANKVKYNLSEQLQRFIDEKKLVLGICNGFQVMVKLGLLPALDGNYFSQSVTLTLNDSGRFEDRWVHLKAAASKCVFTQGIENIYLPVRHGEGKFIPRDDSILKRLTDNNQIVFRYVDPLGRRASYPWNPNGSVDGIAAICDPSGRVFGMMPHPEAFLHRTNHPRWTREDVKEGAGRKLFVNAVEWVKENL